MPLANDDPERPGVETHSASRMRKLGLRKATEQSRYALQHGFIVPRNRHSVSVASTST